MLTNEQIESIIVKIQAIPKLPKGFKGAFGKILLTPLLKEIDRLISDALPNEIYQLINSASDGLTKVEADALNKALTGYLLENVKPKALKAILPLVLPTIVDEIVTALQKGKVLA